MTDSLYVRARLALAVAGQEAADLARGIVGDVSTPMRPGERIRSARRARMLSLTLVDRAVLAELSEGATWETVGEALGVTADEAERRYRLTWDQWQAGDWDDELDFGDHTVGLRGDADLEGTAQSLDSWWNRHKEPWESRGFDQPVLQVLVDGEPAPGDSQGV